VGRRGEMGGLLTRDHRRRCLCSHLAANKCAEQCHEIWSYKEKVPLKATQKLLTMQLCV